MRERARSFGAVARAYERYRPGYPDELVDLVLEYADLPVRTALEIGAGTGKATRVFAARGVTVTAVEPDEAMLEELRRHVPATVVPVRDTLEEVDLDGQVFDLVFAAASLHWTGADRWERIAALLAPGGVFAAFGGSRQLADPALEAAARAARTAYLADDEAPSPGGTDPGARIRWPGTELAADPGFTDVRQEEVPRRLTMSADDYVGHLGTVSAYLTLPEQARRRALEAVRGVLPDEVVVRADLTVHLARRVRPGC